MSWKLLKLSPLKPFFFGKESVFTNTHYAISEYFPQQTQIIGALRLYWMEQNNLMRVHKDGKYVPFEKKEFARKLVGNASALDFEKSDNLGAISYISPMFILESQNKCVKDAIFELPCDIVKKECEYVVAKPKYLDKIVSSKPVVLLEDYDVKMGFLKGLAGCKFWESYINNKTLSCIYEYDDIFESYEQVGIALTDDKQTQDGMFYTKKSYILKENYSFGLLINIDEDIIASMPEKENINILTDGVISLGADGSMFSLEVSDIPKILESHPLISNIKNKTEIKGKKIVLLSDSILPTSIPKDSYFQIIPDKVPFKMMKSKKVKLELEDKKDYMIKEQKQSYIKTEERLLVPKGSVYYFKTQGILEEAKGAYSKMGFNQFLVIN